MFACVCANPETWKHFNGTLFHCIAAAEWVFWFKHHSYRAQYRALHCFGMSITLFRSKMTFMQVIRYHIYCSNVEDKWNVYILHSTYILNSILIPIQTHTHTHNAYNCLLKLSTHNVVCCMLNAFSHYVYELNELAFNTDDNVLHMGLLVWLLSNLTKWNGFHTNTKIQFNNLNSPKWIVRYLFAIAKFTVSKMFCKILNA